MQGGRDLIEEILKFGVKIEKLKSKEYIENGSQMLGPFTV